MENLDVTEKGLRAFVNALNKTVSKDTMSEIGNKMISLRSIEMGAYPITNRCLTAIYQTLFDKTNFKNGAGKEEFNKIQTEWVNNIIKGHEKEIFSNTLLENLARYNNIVSGTDVKVEPDGEGVKITMNEGCMYKEFCDYTNNRKCVRGTAIKHIVNYFRNEPYQFLLERPEGSHACVIRVKSLLESCDILKEYQDKGKLVTLL